MGRKELRPSLSITTSIVHNYVNNLRREPWGTGSDSILWYMQVWRFFSNILGILLLWVGFLYTHKYSQKHKCFLFSILSTSKGVTPVILRQIDSCIAHYRPRCHFITFSESYRSVISILNPLPVILCQKSFLYIHYNIRIKAYISQAFFYLFLSNQAIIMNGMKK